MVSKCAACARYIRQASSSTPDSGFMAAIVQLAVGGLGLHGDLATKAKPFGKAEVIAAPEAARVIPIRPVPGGQQPHGLVGNGQHLGTVGGLNCDLLCLVGNGAVTD